MKSLLVFALLLCALQTSYGLPNIIVALIDDLGHYNVGYHGNTEVKTPTIDQLALKEGIVLSQHYTYQYCSPTRSSLLSGRLPIHVNEDNTPTTFPLAGIPEAMTTIPKKLSQAGYVSHQVGKWHVGQSSNEVIPAGRGFKTSLGYFGGMEDHWKETRTSPCGVHTDLWDTNKPAYNMNNTVYAGDLYRTRVQKILEEHDKSKPLFLYYAMQNVHSPLEVPESYIDEFKNINNEPRRNYTAMISYADDNLKLLTNKLKDLGMWDDTLLVVSSDNGGPVQIAANNYPMRGGKFSDFQGGVRVNAFVTGGVVKSQVGQKRNGFIHICDWYATFCHLADVDPSDNPENLPGIDSINMWDYINGTNQTSPRSVVPLSSTSVTGDLYVNFIKGNYKLLLGEIRANAWQGERYPNNTGKIISLSEKKDCKEGCLFDIINDPYEHKNLASTQTQLVEDMRKESLALGKTVYNPNRGKSDERACKVIQENGGYFAPWLT